MNETFNFTSRLKTISMVLMLIGAAALAGGFVVYSGDEINRVWANLLLDSVFFLGIGMGSAFFIAAVYLAWGGFSVVFKRVPEAISQWMPVAAVILLLVLIAGHGNLYEWTHAEEVEHDPILKGKTAYLNLPFFFIRFAFFLGALVTCTILLRKTS